jgi:quercetin dioxygenase-like cupin family protein
MYEVTTDASALPWSPTGWPGVWMKVLQQAGSNGGMTGMMRMEAGSSIPAHAHTSADQMVFVVDGDLVEAGVSYGPGTFLVARAGAPHGPHGSSGGCVLLSWYSGPPDFVPVG